MYFNVQREFIWFRYEGEEVFEEDTPQDLGMQPGDVLEVFLDERAYEEAEAAELEWKQVAQPALGGRQPYAQSYGWTNSR